jgi:hypothetical protein
MKYFIYNRYKTFIMHVIHLITVELLLFIKPQFTIICKISSTLINARIKMSDRRLTHSLKGVGAAVNIMLEPNTLRNFKCTPTWKYESLRLLK